MQNDFVTTKCNCKNFSIICTLSGKPHIANTGPQPVSTIKKLLNIPEQDSLVQVFENGERKRYGNDETIHIHGCESFYGAPPCATNAHEKWEV